MINFSKIIRFLCINSVIYAGQPRPKTVNAFEVNGQVSMCGIRGIQDPGVRAIGSDDENRALVCYFKNATDIAGTFQGEEFPLLFGLVKEPRFTLTSGFVDACCSDHFMGILNQQFPLTIAKLPSTYDVCYSLVVVAQSDSAAAPQSGCLVMIFDMGKTPADLASAEAHAIFTIYYNDNNAQRARAEKWASLARLEGDTFKLTDQDQELIITILSTMTLPFSVKGKFAVSQELNLAEATTLIQSEFARRERELNTPTSSRASSKGFSMFRSKQLVDGEAGSEDGSRTPASSRASSKGGVSIWKRPNGDAAEAATDKSDSNPSTPKARSRFSRMLTLVGRSSSKPSSGVDSTSIVPVPDEVTAEGEVTAIATAVVLGELDKEEFVEHESGEHESAKLAKQDLDA